MSSIVILDDRLTNRNIFAKLAASIEPDVEVNTFEDPLCALEWLKDHMPDLIITDYKMPHMDGAEFVKAFRKYPDAADIPVIVITVYEDRSFRMHALEVGATDFLHSPVDHQEFIVRARNLLNLRKHQLLLAQKAISLERELVVSERNREDAIRDSRERLAQVIDTLPVMISATGVEGDVLFSNAYRTSFFGIKDEIQALKATAYQTNPEQIIKDSALNKTVFETGGSLPSYEEELIDADGKKFVFLTTKSPLKDISNQVTGVLTSSLDITPRKKTEAHLQYLAHHDALTDLPNRVLLRDRLRRMIAHAKRGGQGFALLILDLDGFKRVNDLLGHTVGDKYIMAVADRLRSTVRESDTLARLGGDEFAILQSGVTNRNDAAAFAKRVLHSVEHGEFFTDKHVPTTASIGIALYPEDGHDVESFLKNADLAMYKAKAESGNHYCFYQSDLNTRAVQDALLDAELREAVDHHQFVIYYQPQVSLRKRCIVGAEALIRWQHPEQGLLEPSYFLPRAEENGLIVPITEWVILNACQEARRWRDLGLPPLRVGVNVSPVQFRRRTVPTLVAQVLETTGLPPEFLDLELTESLVLHDQEEVAGDFRTLSELGVGLAIDDFGTGYSSLGYIKKFPVQRLKIDRSFISHLTTEQNDAAIVRAIITLGHSLDMELVAEGVESADQLAQLHAEGCDEVQGYYFGKPMPADEFIALVQSGHDMMQQVDKVS